MKSLFNSSFIGKDTGENPNSKEKIKKQKKKKNLKNNKNLITESFNE